MTLHLHDYKVPNRSFLAPSEKIIVTQVSCNTTSCPTVAAHTSCSSSYLLLMPVAHAHTHCMSPGNSTGMFLPHIVNCISIWILRVSVVIVKHRFAVNIFMDLHGMGLSSLLFDPVMFCSYENWFCHAVYPHNTQCSNASAIDCTLEERWVYIFADSFTNTNFSGDKRARMEHFFLGI